MQFLQLNIPKAQVFHLKLSLNLDMELSYLLEFLLLIHLSSIYYLIHFIKVYQKIFNRNFFLHFIFSFQKFHHLLLLKSNYILFILKLLQYQPMIHSVQRDQNVLIRLINLKTFDHNILFYPNYQHKLL